LPSAGLPLRFFPITSSALLPYAAIKKSWICRMIEQSLRLPLFY